MPTPRIEALIQSAAQQLRQSNEAIDLEEANNGLTDHMDLLIHEQTWMLADHMLLIIQATEEEG